MLSASLGPISGAKIRIFADIGKKCLFFFGIGKNMDNPEERLLKLT